MATTLRSFLDTASHYLKVVLDAIFGPTNFRNEVVWKRTGAHGAAHRFGPIHDILLFVTRSDSYTWNPSYRAYDPAYVARFKRTDGGDRPFQDVSLTGPGVRHGDSGLAWRGVDPTAGGRHWQPSSTAYELYEEMTGESLADLPMLDRLDRLDAQGLIFWPKQGEGVPRFKQYLDAMPGQPVQDVITDIPPINSQAVERLGYPTQKPIALLERIIAASSNAGDVVLDPFCGCGTAVDAAQKLGRQWIGIDISYLAVALIQNRLDDRYGPDIRKSYQVVGIPHDVAGAQALFNANAFDFERWAVSVIGGRANEKQVGDKGIDGVIRFPIAKGIVGRVLVSVKGGGMLNPAMVRDLRGTVAREKAEMGVLVTLGTPTKGMIEEANKSGSYVYPFSHEQYPRLQIITVPEILSGKRPAGPPHFPPYTQAKRLIEEDNQISIFDG